MTFMFGKTNNGDVCGHSLLVAVNRGEVLRYGLQSQQPTEGNPYTAVVLWFFEEKPYPAVIDKQQMWLFDNDDDADREFSDDLKSVKNLSNYVFFEELADFYLVISCLEHSAGLKFAVSTANKKALRFDWKYICWNLWFTFSVPFDDRPTLQSLTASMSSDTPALGKIYFSVTSNAKSHMFVQPFDTPKRGSTPSKISPTHAFVPRTQCLTAMYDGIACSFPVRLPHLPGSRVAVSAAYVDLFFGPQKPITGLPFAHLAVTKQIASIYSEKREQLQQLVTVKELQRFFVDNYHNQEELQTLDFYEEVLPAFVNGLQVVRLLCVENVESSEIAWKQFHDSNECLGTILIVTKSLPHNRFEVSNSSGIVVGWFFQHHLQQVDSWNQPRNICSGSSVVCPVENNVSKISSDTASVVGIVVEGTSDFTDGTFRVRRIDGSIFVGKWGVVSRSQDYQTSNFYCRIINKTSVSKFYEQGFCWCSGDDDSIIRCESKPQFRLGHDFFCSSHRPSSSKDLIHLSCFGQNMETEVELKFKPDFFGTFSDILNTPHPGELLQYPWNEWQSEVKIISSSLWKKNPKFFEITLKLSKFSENLAKGVFVSFFGDWGQSKEMFLSQLIKMGEHYEVVDVVEESKQAKFSIVVPVLERVAITKETKPQPSDCCLFVRLSCLASKNDSDDIVVKLGLKTSKYLECELIPFSADVPQMCPGLVLQTNKPLLKKQFTVVAPNNSKNDKFHLNKNIMLLGDLFVTFDSKSDPILIGKIYSDQGVGLTSQFQVHRDSDIVKTFEKFSFFKKELSSESFTKLDIGDKVVRGPDWQWGNQDGGRTGEITEVESKWVQVQWQNGNSNM
jgi:hypothetical protein